MSTAPPSTPAPPSWARSADAIAADLGVDLARGLSSEEVARRLVEHGPNELPQSRSVSALTLAAGQLRGGVVWLLAGAAVVAGALGDRLDAVAVLAIVILNAVIGFLQEYRAERAVAALRRLAAPVARIVRDGRLATVPAAGVVPGDVVLLEAGDIVAADARLVEASALRAGEAPLTGESEPVTKDTAVRPADTPLADRGNVVFLGTSIVHGAGRAVVVATGARTEAGRIAGLLGEVGERQTPLHRRLDEVARRLATGCLAVVALVFVLGWLRGDPIGGLLLAAVALAVAAVPEGLPAVVTVALAVGVQRMARRNVLVRRLASVESLGSVHIICTDKTGTLTVGEMTARRLVTPDAAYAVTGEGYATEGAFFVDGAPRTAEADPGLRAVLEAAACASEASVEWRDGRAAVVGDPLDAALLTVAAKAGLSREVIDARMPRIGLVPFDAERRRMTVVRRRDGGACAFVKGAPEAVLARCTMVRTIAGVVPMDEPDRARMLEATALLASDALRVIAVAERVLPDRPPALEADALEQDLVFLGLVGLQDPPRAEARAAVRRCRRAGIRTVMVTGDHPATAAAIARELEIIGPADLVATGADLDRLGPSGLAAQVERIAVYARVSPEHKLAIVRAWQAQGAVVAMTGDGVNDAPALAAAAVGVAMGRTGTEVSKAAADIIVTDDNFAAIVAAVEEGRCVHDNIGKTLGFLLAGNAAELLVVLAASIAGWPLPLLPAHLLWINLVTDGLPALALATEGPEPGTLTRPPRPASAPLLDRRRVALIVLAGCLTAGVSFAVFAVHLSAGAELARARDAAFTVLVVAELARALGARNDRLALWQMGWVGSARLLGVVLAGVSLQIAVHHLEPFRSVLSLTRVDLVDSLGWIALGLVPLVALEVRKILARRGGEQT